MAEPSNIRVNPFTGTGGATNYVELTERHVIPAVSPYVIRLNEVPEKQDPSNMKMVYVDSATGAATENTLTEVAATPGQGEFRPDYSTNAMEDKTWNTGLIEFSASDAGKMVQVTYTGTGTLAAVNSNNWPSWYTDRGDGSDGDFVPAENTTISGVKNYKSVFIKEGVTVTIDKFVMINCQGAFVNEGIITAAGKGYTSSTQGFTNNGGAGGTATGVGSTGGGAGGSGGYYFNQYLTVTLTQELLEKLLVIGIGTGGGAGGSADQGTGGQAGIGGGSITIICNSFLNNNITVNGTDGGNGVEGGSGFNRCHTGGGGGGAGGTIVVIANNIIKQGTLSANGGSGGASGGGNATSGGNGGAGFIYTKALGV